MRQLKIGDKIIAKIYDKNICDRSFKIKSEVINVKPDNSKHPICILYKHGFEIIESISFRYLGKNGWYVLPSEVIAVLL